MTVYYVQPYTEQPSSGSIRIVNDLYQSYTMWSNRISNRHPLPYRCAVSLELIRFQTKTHGLITIVDIQTWHLFSVIVSVHATTEYGNLKRVGMIEKCCLTPE